MKIRDFITGLFIMLFVGLMLTSCRKQEKRILGDWEGVDSLGRKTHLQVKEDGIVMTVFSNGNEHEIHFCVDYYEDNHAVCVVDNVKQPFTVRRGKLYMFQCEYKRR